MYLSNTPSWHFATFLCFSELVANFSNSFSLTIWAPLHAKFRTTAKTQKGNERAVSHIQFSTNVNPLADPGSPQNFIAHSKLHRLRLYNAVIKQDWARVINMDCSLSHPFLRVWCGVSKAGMWGVFTTRWHLPSVLCGSGNVWNVGRNRWRLTGYCFFL